MQRGSRFREPLHINHSESKLLEEVVTLVIHEDECREVLYMDLPDRLHSELRIFHAFNALDVVLSKDCSRTTD